MYLNVLQKPFSKRKAIRNVSDKQKDSVIPPVPPTICTLLPQTCVKAPQIYKGVWKAATQLSGHPEAGHRFGLLSLVPARL